ncbi:hypothetical protein M8J77_017792 [Diaphorina citri]|nr:hypothetical protein M8J77_017792 [Diaphorina citri]
MYHLSASMQVKVRCTICQLVCKSKSGYSSHVKRKHNEEVLSLKPKKVLTNVIDLPTLTQNSTNNTPRSNNESKWTPKMCCLRESLQNQCWTEEPPEKRTMQINFGHNGIIVIDGLPITCVYYRFKWENGKRWYTKYLKNDLS